MFGQSTARGLAARFKASSFVSRCDEAVTDADDDMSDNAFSIEDEKFQQEQRRGGPRFRQPMAFENLMGVLRQGSVNNYDGFRVVVQKQINMNTIASHFYWIGSQTAPPIYQYRLILPFDDKVVNVATDMDFNVEGELRCPILPSINGKASFSINEQQGNNLTFDVDMVDESSATQLQYSPSNGHSLAFSYMQSMSKSLILGGLAEYAGSKHILQLSFGGAYDDGDNVLAAQWDSNVRLMYLKRVNPNRVHLCADMVLDDKGSSTMTFGAEYMLKQSKIQMSLDSNLLLKSYLETQIGPGISLQLCAEMQQQKEHYKFGYGLQLL